jgi:hypothetical protein
MEEKVISINSENVDYWQWGRNCAILGYDQEEAENIIATDREKSYSDYDLFYEGYYSKGR